MEELSEQELRERASLVGELGRALHSKDVSLETVLSMIKLVIKEKKWTQFLTVVNEPVTYPETAEGFIKFITTPRINGLGTTLDVVKRNIRDDKEALASLDEALQRPDGGDQRSEDAITVYNVHGDVKRPSGNSEERAIRALRNKRPDLLERVKSGDMSAHAATLEAGLRKPTATVPLHSMSRLAAALRRRLDDEELAELISLLLRNEDSEV